MMMRLRLNTYVAPLLFLLFLVSSSVVQSSRPLTTEQEQNTELEKVSAREENIVLELEEVESFKLMGMEEKCNIGDEECMQRRMTLEAHLDYIYTQHHKP